MKPPELTTIRVQSTLAIVTLVYLAGVVYSSVLSVEDATRSVDGLTVLSFVPLLLGCALLIAQEVGRRPVSLHVIHLFYIFIFYGLSGLIQYITGVFPFSTGLVFDTADILTCNAVMLGWLGFYWAGYRFRQSTRTGFVETTLSREATWPGMVLCSAVAVGALVWLASAGFLGLVTRAEWEHVIISNDATVQLMVEAPTQGLPLVALGGAILFFQRARNRGRTLPGLIMGALFVGVLVADNPVANARLWAGMAIIAILTITWLRNQRMNVILAPALIAAFFIALPLLDLGRRQTSAEAYQQWQPEQVSGSFLTTGDSDAFTGVLRTQRYIEHTENLGLGRQLVGALLVWIPRRVWPTKPIGTGNTVAEAFGFRFTNIAAALPAEALIDFGYLGLPIFAMVFGRILRRLDDLYDRRSTAASTVRLIDIIYPFWLGMVLVVSRGSMVNGVIYTSAITLGLIPFAATSKRTLLAMSQQMPTDLLARA